MSHFAERLKALRAESGLTMQALADSANVSKSMICKIERDEVQPTIDVAGRLSKALGKTLSEMLHATHEAQVVFLPKEAQAIWEDANKIKRRNISPVFEGLKIEWLHTQIPAGKSIASNMHLMVPGSGKYLLVTKGILSLKINERTYKLKKGDSIYFDGSCAHELVNVGKDMLECYIVVKHG